MSMPDAAAERSPSSSREYDPATSEKRERLAALAQSIRDADVCPELAAHATLVRGEGNPNADLFFIGEAPGAKEDATGRPFVGAAGTFFGVMLESIQLTRDDIYVTNIVKYRPPDNRDPSPAEKAAFLPYLLEEIAIVQPKAIITFGRHPMEHFLPGVLISTVHGQAYSMTVGELPVTFIPLYHPSAAAHRPGLRQTLLDDFLTIPDILEQYHPS